MSIFSKVKAKVASVGRKTKLVAAGVAIALAGLAGAATLSSVGASPISTPDCNANAVVWCGASTPAQLSTDYHTDKGDGHNSSASIQRIYAHFGIDSSKIDSLKNTVANGYVTKSGDVYATINGQNTLVATGAMTAGRQLILGSNGSAVAGQTKVTVSGTTFYTRAPSVSFLNDQLTAMVSMQNGQFQFAILVSCGNPVTATPKKPNYTITKQVSNGGSFASSVSNVKSGSTLKYQITVSSTGQIPVQNVKVHDTLPAGLSYVKGSLQQDGKAVTGVSETNFFTSTGVTIASIKNGSKVVFTFQAKAGNVDFADTSCKPATLDNTGSISAPSLPNESSSAKASTICAPAVALSCTSLTAVAGTPDAATGAQKYSFTTKASVTNATITNYAYDFGDGNKANGGATIDHTYQPGTRTANVIITAVAPATNKTYTTTVTKACEVTITVKPPVSGTLACTGLTAIAGTPNAATGATQYTLKATGQVTGNAKITNYVFTPGDNGADITVATSNTSASTTHTYQPGNWTATVDVNGTDLVTGNAISAPANAKCSVPITVKHPTPSSLACTGLALTAGAIDAQGNTAYTLKATASATNAHISTYTFTFGDGGTTAVASTATSASTTHTYAPGTYTASVAVSGTDAAGNALSAPVNVKCSAPITVKIPECKPGVPVGSPQCKPSSLACVVLGAVLGDDNATYTFTATASTTNATLTTYTFDFGDKSQPIVVSTGNTTATATHTYAPGAFTAAVSVSGKDAAGNSIQAPANPKCSMPINIKTPECKPGVPQGNESCFTYTCNQNQLVSTIDNTSRSITLSGFTIALTTTNPNATLSNVVINWGDGASTTFASSDITAQTSQAHRYADTSTRSVTVTPQFTAAGQTEPVPGTACVVSASFTALPPTLPKTGAGDTIGLFFGAVAAGIVGFRLYTIRKLSRY